MGRTNQNVQNSVKIALLMMKIRRNAQKLTQQFSVLSPTFLNKSFNTFHWFDTIRCHFHDFNLFSLSSNYKFLQFKCSQMNFFFTTFTLFRWNEQEENWICSQFLTVSHTENRIVKHPISPYSDVENVSHIKNFFFFLDVDDDYSTKHCFRLNINGSCEWKTYIDTSNIEQDKYNTKQIHSALVLVCCCFIFRYMFRISLFEAITHTLMATWQYIKTHMMAYDTLARTAHTRTHSHTWMKFLGLTNSYVNVTIKYTKIYSFRQFN